MAYKQNKLGFTITIDGVVIAKDLSRENSLAILSKHKNYVDLQFYLGRLSYSEAIRINRKIFNTQNELMELWK